LEEVVVIAPYGTAIDPTLVPANVQRAGAEQLQRSQSLDLTDFLNRQFGSVSINHAQNNPLQPDFNFRGFTASPLLGLPQGLSVYENGVRINDPFGDTINWDLIPVSAIDNVQMLAGTQPVFGLNTLGGALSLRLKNGFSQQGIQLDAYGGAFGRFGTSLQAGGNDGRWGYYGDVDYFKEDGWRDHSYSDALRVYGALSRHESDWTVDLSAAYANTELRGNGPAPVELLAIDRSAVFTYPDITHNEHAQLILEGSRDLSDSSRISGNAFYRRLDTDTFNGDATAFEQCELGGNELLAAADSRPVGWQRAECDQQHRPAQAGKLRRFDTARPASAAVWPREQSHAGRRLQHRPDNVRFRRGGGKAARGSRHLAYRHLRAGFRDRSRQRCHQRERVFPRYAQRVRALRGHIVRALRRHAHPAGRSQRRKPRARRQPPLRSLQSRARRHVPPRFGDDPVRQLRRIDPRALTSGTRLRQ
jgi:hypothetical protein